MNKLILLLFLITSTVSAVPMDNEGNALEGKEIRKVTIDEFVGIVKEQDPNHYNWCESKGKLFVAAMNDRDTYPREEAIDLMQPIRDKLPTYKAIEITRILNDVYRLKNSGDYRIDNTDENREKFNKKEFISCIINGF